MTPAGGGSRILVIDDERPLRRLLEMTLGAHGFEVRSVPTGAEGIAEAAAFRPDGILLDLGLPDGDGKAVLARIREWSDVPVIVLTARDREEEKIEALDSGADDYVVKPFSTGELLARLRAVLRRISGASSDPVLRCGPLALDPAARLATRGGTELRLTPTEYDLLKLFLRNAGKVLTHRQILRGVWGAGFEDAHVVRVYVAQLRRKIEEDPAQPRYLLTETGVGYRMSEGQEERPGRGEGP